MLHEAGELIGFLNEPLYHFICVHLNHAIMKNVISSIHLGCVCFVNIDTDRSTFHTIYGEAL